MPVPCAMPNPAARPTATRTADGKRVRARVRVEDDMSTSLHSPRDDDAHIRNRTAHWPQTDERRCHLTMRRTSHNNASHDDAAPGSEPAAGPEAAPGADRRARRVTDHVGPDRGRR